MKRSIPKRQALAVLLNGGMAAVAVAAAVGGWWEVAVIALAVMMTLLTLVSAHNHLRIGNTWRLLAREVKYQRKRERDQERNGTREPIRWDETTERLVAAITEAVRAAVPHSGSVDEQLLTRLDLVERRLGLIGRSLVSATGRLEERARRSSDEVEDRLRQHEDFAARWSGDVEMLYDRLDSLRHEPVTEIDALIQLHRRFPFDGSIPLMWGWAMSPRGLLQLVDTCEEEKPELVVECGSGTSTLFLAAALRDRPGARIVALEHLEDFARRTRELLERHGLDQLVDVRFAPLAEVLIDGRPHEWYDPDQWTDLDGVDLVVVDGPPRATGPGARYPAFPLLRRSLSAEAVIVLDDAQREDESIVRRRWLRTPGLEPDFSITSDLAVMRWVGRHGRLGDDDR